MKLFVTEILINLFICSYNVFIRCFLIKIVLYVFLTFRICVNPYNYCSACDFCVRGQPQFCVKEAMKTALGYNKDGGFQQFIVLPGQLCFVLPPTMQLKQSVFCQPLSTILRGWDNMGKIALDSKILIAGAGNCNCYSLVVQNFICLNIFVSYFVQSNVIFSSKITFPSIELNLLNEEVFNLFDI